MKHPFIFFELRTNDVGKAKKFYAKLFGWKVEEMPMGEGVVYPMLKVEARKDFGTGITDNPAKKGFPSHWTPYVVVDNCSSFTKKAAKLGGKVAQQPKDFPWGIVSTILDPTGAAFSLWQAKLGKK